MKTSHLICVAAFVALAATGCDRKPSAAEQKISELERKNSEAVDRQRELEQQLEDQKIAAEREAIERERAMIEEDREELERREGEALAAEDEELRAREEALANREGQLDQFQSALEEKQDDLQEWGEQLDDHERDLAGREALAFEDSEVDEGEPIADYDTFYDALEPYGSWFETPTYGYVWQPVAVRDSNWRPYSRGRWVCSDRGWNWISEEPFGWATYHYGRWARLKGHGWIWVPGSQWAPCWVSWRENDSHIGWAPLPPETLAYRGHSWDSTVDVQFGIGASCFTFVEIRHFGGSVFGKCLPASRNDDCFGRTRNTTFIHHKGRHVICGGPQYRHVSDRIGKPLPFYRLQMDHHSRPGRDPLGLRPRVRGEHLVVAAPNMDAAWNEKLKPKRIKERIEAVEVERSGSLSPEISNRFRQDREERRQRAGEAVASLGGEENFDERRVVQLQENRRKAEGKDREGEPRDVKDKNRVAQRDDSGNRERQRSEGSLPSEPRGDRANRENEARITPSEPSRVRQPAGNPERPAVAKANPESDSKKDARAGLPQGMTRDTRETRPQRDEPARVTPPEPRKINQEELDALQLEEKRREQQRQADLANRARKEAANRKQEELDREKEERQRLADEERKARKEAEPGRQDEAAGKSREQQSQREMEQDREARKQVAEDNERTQRQQQEDAKQRQQERTDRQQQETQQKEMQRSRDESAQRQQEKQRQQQDESRQQQQQQEAHRAREESRRQQQQEESRRQEREENQRQQENARQREREENQRQQEQARQRQEENQRQQEQARQRQEESQRQRQQEESRQKQERDEEDRKKNR
jgi:hypothetical protein